MKLSKDILLLLVVLVGAAGAGMWVLQMDAQVTPAQPSEVEEGINERSPLLYQPNSEGRNTKGMKSAQIKSEFEAIINAFLQNLEIRMIDYRKKRQTIQDVIKPQSMRSFEYVQENDIFARTIMAEMEAEMDAVVREFTKTDLQMRELLGRMEPEDAGILIKEWDVTREKQLSQYEAFFAQERKVFDLYRIILEVYAESGGAYNVNLEKGTVTFEDAQLQAAYDDAIYIINEITSRDMAPARN